MPQLDRYTGAHDVTLLLMPFGQRNRLGASAQENKKQRIRCSIEQAAKFAHLVCRQV
jgi:hypothetical protein